MTIKTNLQRIIIKSIRINFIRRNIKDKIHLQDNHIKCQPFRTHRKTHLLKMSPEKDQRDKKTRELRSKSTKNKSKTTRNWKKRLVWLRSKESSLKRWCKNNKCWSSWKENWQKREAYHHQVKMKSTLKAKTIKSLSQMIFKWEPSFRNLMKHMILLSRGSSSIYVRTQIYNRWSSHPKSQTLITYQSQMVQTASKVMLIQAFQLSI